MKRKIAFIVNPSAGTKKKDFLEIFLRDSIPGDIHFEILYWANKHDFESIRKFILSSSFTDLVAVGGDGTVNEVAKVAVEKNLPLGIIPHGSGNGLARSLNISMKTTQALKTILKGKTTCIDGGMINGRMFFCTSGVGFDAHIGFLFAQLKSRGLWGYVKTTLREIFKYKSTEYRITLNGQTFTRDAFLITFANAGQYGNDFYISPEAKVNDGLLHIVILKPFLLMSAPSIFLRIILRKAHSSRFIETFTSDKVSVRRVEKGPIHFDGEPGNEGFEINVDCKKNILNVLID
ncbi:MAG: diacylglycerol/lipid kinase family protein [Bacteroidota bacterium]|jgi:diacylglycerol kinase (ATP)